MQQICDRIQIEQRNRAALLKSRIMFENRLTAYVAQWMGYKASDDEQQRAKSWIAAGKLIKEVADDEDSAHPLRGMIFGTYVGIDAFDIQIKAIEKKMISLASELPVAAWVEADEQRGFGMKSLAIVIGEAGNLSNYPNPAKLWRRMGCAPFTSRGKTLMGATWKSGKQGKLTAEEWAEFGYSPRRRSIAYLIGENLQKQNGPQESKGDRPAFAGGPYRQRYDVKKAEFALRHPDDKPLHSHLHGMLLAAKLLLKNLWIEWNGRGDRNHETGTFIVASVP